MRSIAGADRALRHLLSKTDENVKPYIENARLLQPAGFIDNARLSYLCGFA
jgi:hypothetical protein